jgi:hypothetical protein
MVGDRHIVLLGASIGRAWRIEELPRRLELRGFGFDYVGVFAFDKSEALTALLEDSHPRPHGIILKECAAYFPGNLEQMRSLMEAWVDRCERCDVVPIPATVAPIALSGPWRGRIPELMRVIRGRTSARERLTGILRYNDWLRDFAEKAGVAILDLESVLRCSEHERRLRGDLHTGDGLHLNPKAYDLLDRAVVRTLQAVFPGSSITS